MNLTSGAKTTVMILNFQTDRSGQTVQTQIRLFLEGLSCLQFRLHLLDRYLCSKNDNVSILES